MKNENENVLCCRPEAEDILASSALVHEREAPELEKEVLLALVLLATLRLAQTIEELGVTRVHKLVELKKDVEIMRTLMLLRM